MGTGRSTSVNDDIGTVRHRDGVYAMKTSEQEWFTTVPLGELQRWVSDVTGWDVVYRP